MNNERIMPCGHDISNIDRGVESETTFCRMCDLEARCRDAEKREKELKAERDEYKRRAELWERLHDERVNALRIVESKVAKTQKILGDYDGYENYKSLCDIGNILTTEIANAGKIRIEELVEEDE